jgi:hypothetical protein
MQDKRWDDKDDKRQTTDNGLCGVKDAEKIKFIMLLRTAVTYSLIACSSNIKALLRTSVILYNKHKMNPAAKMNFLSNFVSQLRNFVFKWNAQDYILSSFKYVGVVTWQPHHHSSYCSIHSPWNTIFNSTYHKHHKSWTFIFLILLSSEKN